MDSDPFFTLAIVTIGLVVGMIYQHTRRMNSVFALALQQQDASKAAVILALDVARQTTQLMGRVEHKALQAVGIVPKSDEAQRDFDDYLRYLEGVATLGAPLVVGKGKGEVSVREYVALTLIEGMEANAAQPPTFWPVEVRDEEWEVLYEQDLIGVECFPPASLTRPATETEARYVAARLNLHEASRQAQRPLLAYQDYRPELAELFGEVWDA